MNKYDPVLDSVKRLFGSTKLSQREFAKQCKLPHTTIVRVFNGQIGISNKTLTAICKGFDCHIELVSNDKEDDYLLQENILLRKKIDEIREIVRKIMFN